MQKTVDLLTAKTKAGCIRPSVAGVLGRAGCGRYAPDQGKHAKAGQQALAEKESSQVVLRGAFRFMPVIRWILKLI